MGFGRLTNRAVDAKLLIFDVGGVLRDSSLAVNEGFRRGFESAGIKYDFKTEDVWHLRGIGKYNRSNEAIKALLALTRASENPESDLRKVVENERAEEMLDELTSRYLRDSDEELIERIRSVYRRFFASPQASKLVRIFPFVNEAIDMLSKKFTLAIFSNASKPTVYRDLKEVNLNRFSLIIAKEDVTQPKPSEEGIVKIMEKLNFTPKEAAYVGDTVIDITAARRAGCKVIAVLSGMGLEIHLRRANPDYLFKHVLEMAEVFCGEEIE